MKQMVRALIVALLCVAPLTANAQQPGPREWTLRYSLINATHAITLAHLYTGAMDAQPYSPRTGDLVAEYLLQFAADPKLNAHYSAELIAALPSSAGGRYRQAMQELRASKAPVGVKIAALDYLQGSKEGDPMYRPGSVDLGALRTAFIDAALAITPTEERARKLGDLREGDSLERLFNLLGPPQAVRVYDVSRIRRLIFYYRGAGRVVFGAFGDVDWRLQAVTADPMLTEAEMPYRARAAQLGLPDDATLRMMQLATGRLLPAKIAVETAYDAPSVSLEFLDATAEYLARNWRDVSPETEDTLAWFIRLLQKRGGPRYESLLDDIANGSSSLKLRRWAGQTIQRPKDVPRTPYVAGTVPLVAIARKYPELYPEVTFTRGRL